MWETRFKHSGEGLECVTHDFGNKILVESNLKTKTIKRLHGGISVWETDRILSLGEYEKLLERIDVEVNGNRVNN